MIYLCKNVDIDISQIKLPADRKAKLSRYRRQTDRNLCAIAYGLFSVGAAREYGIDEPIQWHGKFKPYTEQPIHFNISHCDLGAVCVIDTGEVGIDIQDYASVGLDAAQIVCSDEEKREILSSPNPKKSMCRAWCLKESYAKYTGEGLCGEILSFCGKSGERFIHVGKHFTVFDLEDCCMAVCAERFFAESDIVKTDIFA